MIDKKARTANIGYTSCGFKSNLQVHRSLARAVTVDNEVATNSRTLHTLNVMAKCKKSNLTSLLHIDLYFHNRYSIFCLWDSKYNGEHKI